MHKQWQVLIPYYLNGTLNPPDVAALEHHLASCAVCRDAVEDWRLVAGAVYGEVAGMAAQTPPMTDGLRVAARMGPASSANGHSQATIPTAAVHPDAVPQDRLWTPGTLRAPRRRVQFPLTLVAVFAVVIAFGALLAYIGMYGSAPDDTPGQFGHADDALFPTFTPSASPLYTPQGSPTLRRSVTPTALPPTVQVATQPVDDLGILAVGPDEQNTSTPPAGFTPTAVFHYQIGGGYILETIAPIDALPAGTRVRILSARFDGVVWWYTVSSPTGITVQARGQDLMIVMPGPTPTSPLNLTGAWGYDWITIEQVGQIPAFSRVCIGAAFYTGAEWIYEVHTQDLLYGGARAYQLEWSPNPNPTASPTIYATPTAVWDAAIGNGRAMITQAQVGDIPAGVRVHIAAARYAEGEWVYTIQDGAGTHAEARTWQIRLEIDMPADGSPTPYITPTAAFYGLIGTDLYWLQTKEQIGDIPAGTWVRVVDMMYDGIDWLYTIVTESGVAGQAYTTQLRLPPPTPTPTLALNVTPTAVFYGLIGTGEYRLQTKVPVGAIPAGTWVRVVDMRFDGIDWLYTIVTQSGVQAEAYTAQLLYPPPTPTPTLAITATPSATYTLMPTPEP